VQLEKKMAKQNWRYLLLLIGSYNPSRKTASDHPVGFQGKTFTFTQDAQEQVDLACALQKLKSVYLYKKRPIRRLDLTQVETRQYNLAVLIILVIFCWPAAILYYFTRPKTITQQGYPPQPYPQQPPPQYQQQPITRICTQCGRVVPENTKFCVNCGKQLD
jgi:hypothetical protein